MVDLSRANAQKAGVADKATFRNADLFETDLSEATVITMFLLPQINMKLRPRILDLKPGTRVVSNSFTMEDWVADETATASGDCETWCTAYFWIVPAKVDGKWQTPTGELTFVQTFQMVTGTLQSRRGERAHHRRPAPRRGVDHDDRRRAVRGAGEREHDRGNGHHRGQDPSLEGDERRS